MLLDITLLFFLGSYIVAMNESHRKMIIELIEIISDKPYSPETGISKQQTWDEKYEDELERISQIMRGNSGLQDIPTVRSYDTPN